jgi:hypothetical protein
MPTSGRLVIPRHDFANRRLSSSLDQGDCFSRRRSRTALEYDSRSKRADEKEDDPRVRATSRIWGMMIPILALSIPICAISHLGVILPFIAVIAGGRGNRMRLDRRRQRRKQRKQATT